MTHQQRLGLLLAAGQTARECTLGCGRGYLSSGADCSLADPCPHSAVGMGAMVGSVGAPAFCATRRLPCALLWSGEHAQLPFGWEATRLRGVYARRHTLPHPTGGYSSVIDYGDCNLQGQELEWCAACCCGSATGVCCRDRSLLAGASACRIAESCRVCSRAVANLQRHKKQESGEQPRSGGPSGAAGPSPHMDWEHAGPITQ